jgi:hypothetical protein
MASPFTAEIIQFGPARALARDSLPPAPVSLSPNADDPGQRFVEPVALARAMRDEPTRRAIEARLNGAARHVVIDPPTRRISLSAVVFCILTWGVIGGCFVLIASGRL